MPPSRVEIFRSMASVEPSSGKFIRKEFPPSRKYGKVPTVRTMAPVEKMSQSHPIQNGGSELSVYVPVHFPIDFPTQEIRSNIEDLPNTELILPPNRVAPPAGNLHPGLMQSFEMANPPASSSTSKTSFLGYDGVSKTFRTSAGIQSPMAVRRMFSQKFMPLAPESTTSSGRFYSVSTTSTLSNDSSRVSRTSVASSPISVTTKPKQQEDLSNSMKEDYIAQPRFAYVRSCIGILRALEIMVSLIAVLLTLVTPQCVKPMPCAEEEYMKWREFFAGIHIMVMLSSLVMYVACATGIMDWESCQAAVKDGVELIYLIGMETFLAAAVIGLIVYHGNYIWNIIGLVFGCVTTFLYVEHSILTVRQIMKNYRSKVKESACEEDKAGEKTKFSQSVSGVSSVLSKSEDDMVSINLDSPSDYAVIKFKELEGLT